MANRKNTFLIKRSNVAGKVPTAGDLQLGELAINTSDVILYASGTTANSILPIGWDRVARTGDTMTGGLFTPYLSATTISATTYLNLPSITGLYLPLSGGTVTGGTIFTDGITANTISTVDYINFKTSPSVPNPTGGTLYYDSSENALSYKPLTNQNDVTINLGQESLIRIYNNSGTQINNGQVVHITGSTSGVPTVALANASKLGTTFADGLAQSSGVSTHNIPNGEYGFITNFGIVRDLDTSTFIVGQELFLSDTIDGGITNDPNSIAFTSRISSLGLCLTSDAVNGKIYVKIENENLVQSLTQQEVNVLLGNTISTGVYEFTGMTVASTTTFNIAPTRGWIVKNTYQYATLPEVTNLYYTGGTNISVTNIASADSTYVLITSALTVTQQVTFPTPQQRRENIYLGKINHPNRTSILNINNTVDYDVSPMSALRDLWSPIKLINQGIIPSPNGANLSFNTSAGTLWGNGINWHNNQLNPNSVSISGKTPASFFYRTQTGGTSSSVTVIDPTKYEIGGVITSISPAGSNDATNQRIYLYPTGVINVLYGQTRYTTLAAAIAAIQSETFIPYPNAESTGILIGVISVRNDIVADGQPLTNTDYAKFTLVSKFGESFGGTGGLSTTTLQQAYNNSTTPEIVINSTLGGLSIQNGTGNADNTTHLLEGLNTAGNTTSFIRADGYISGTTFQSNGFRANNDGVTATTVSASTVVTNNLTVSGGTQSWFSGNSSSDLVRITQTGSGNAFVVEDSTSTDTSSFTISNAGDVGIGIAPEVQYKLKAFGTGTIAAIYGIGGTAGVQGSGNQYGVYGYVDGNLLIGVFGQNLYGTGTNAFGVVGSAINGIGVRGVGGIYGGKFEVDNQNGSPIGVYATVSGGENGGTGAYIAGKFDASGGEQNYALQLLDSTQGINKVLVSQTSDGKANWSSTLSGLTGVYTNTISATTYSNLPIDIRVTGGTYSSGTATFTNNTGGTFTVTGFSTGGGSEFTGGTVTGPTVFTGGLTANTISATTINTTNLYVTGGTQSVFSGNSSVEMVKIIQSGSGDAFVVQDQANGDASHFVINASGNTAIGLTAPIGNDKLTVSGNTTIYGTLSATTYVGLPNSGVLVVPIATSSVSIGTGSNDYYLNFKIPYNLTISKVDFSVSIAGSDSVRIGIYRGQDLTAVLVGQSTGGTVSTLNSVSIVAESGQNLTFSGGSWIVIGVAVGGTTTNLYGSACPANNLIAWTNTADSSGGFPANPRSKAGTRTSFPSIEITVA